MVIIDKKKIKDRNYLFTLLILHLGIIFYSASAVFLKLAGKAEIFSFGFFLMAGSSLTVMMLYAVIWQFSLKKLPLSTAYANRSLSIVWGVVFGIVVFKERVSISLVIGAAIILAGAILVVTSDE
ncbi:MAG: transporter [Ruminococcaceae bacterium]|nr:transporter [Oscillospiraceae bacterium]